MLKGHTGDVTSAPLCKVTCDCLAGLARGNPGRRAQARSCKMRGARRLRFADSVKTSLLLPPLEKLCGHRRVHGSSREQQMHLKISAKSARFISAALETAESHGCTLYSRGMAQGERERRRPWRSTDLVTDRFAELGGGTCDVAFPIIWQI